MNDAFILGALFVALVVLPSIYLWILWRYRGKRRHSPSRFELLSGFGSLGGWLLCFALLGSGPLIILPISLFQGVIAAPLSLSFLWKRTHRRKRPTGYHSLSFVLHAANAFVLVAITLSGIVASICAGSKWP